MRILTRTIWVLSLVSLFTDMASEMLYPVMPVYLNSIHFSVFLIGILEGFAEAIAGLSKGYFGKLSDHKGKRLPFVQWGYFLSALSKPLMAAFIYPLWVFAVRTLDRLGKGIRTGARDAMLSEEAVPATKARVFGFHRSMDTIGAVAGPAIALLYLYLYPGNYKTLFLIAFFPGLLAIGLSFLLKDRPRLPQADNTRVPFFDFARYLGRSPENYRRLIGGLLAFALINSSDVFLLLRIKESTGSDTATIGSYIFYNLVYALLSYPAGIIADRIGVKNVFLSGMLLFALAYFLMATGSTLPYFATALILYGIYAAATEGIAKAWISNIAAREDMGTAIGTYAGFQSICTLLASSITGFIWWRYGAFSAFLFTSLGTLVVSAYLFLAVPPPIVRE